MRIIAGQWRGRRITAPAGTNTRPILDRVKTVLFDVLGAQLAEPGRLPEIAVLDLFAGSGALGLEALSRGAAYCHFVERRRDAASCLRKNFDELGIVTEADVTEGDASMCDWILPHGEEAEPYKLVFMDPPYRMLTGPKPDRLVHVLLRRLVRDPAIDPEAWIVVRHPRQKTDEPDLAPLVEFDRREVADMSLRFMAQPSAKLLQGDW